MSLRDVTARAEKIRKVLPAPELRQPAPGHDAYVATVSLEVALIAVLNGQIELLGQVVAEHYCRHRDANICTRLPGLGVILRSRILGAFGDDPHRYADAEGRKAYAGIAPITRASAPGSTAQVRPQPRLGEVGVLLHAWLARSPSYHQSLRALGNGHPAALRQLANSWVGIVHGSHRYCTF